MNWPGKDQVLDAVTLAAFALLIGVFVRYVSFYARQEHQNAMERWQEVIEKRKGEADGGDTGWGREDGANLLKKFANQEVVISPELGRGCIVLPQTLQQGNREVVVVEFDILNELRHVLIKDLLFVGMRLKHAKRGLGTIDLFDFVEERAHVKFDSGEYHRYLLNSWKSKMVARERYAGKKKTFERFFQDYLFYRIDYVLSNFTFAKPLLLSIMSLTLIVVGALLYALASGTKLSESTWVAWTLVASSGSQASIEESGIVRGIAATLTLGGMLVFALVISLMADGVSNLLDELKQGNALVIQSGHTLILGWSDKIIPVVRELCLATNHQHVIVILAERPKSEMEHELHQRLSKDELQNTLMIFRSGNPSMQEELNKVCAGSAKSVVILADSNLSADESDARVVRCVLSLQGVRLPTMGHIVVEMCDVDNRDLGLLADSKNVEVVVAHDLIGRLMIQSAREPGLSHVLEKLLGFENEVLSLYSFPELEACTFGELLFRFEDAVPIGIKPFDRHAAYQQVRNSKWRKRSLIRRDWDGTLKQSSFNTSNTEEHLSKSFSKDAAPIIDHFDKAYDSSEEDQNDLAFTRRVMMNPPNDYVLAAGDEIMFISSRKLTSPVLKSFSHLPKNAYRSFLTMKPAHRPIVLTKPERFLFCGWRRDVDDIILELDELVCKGSEVTILCNMEIEDRMQRFEQGGMDVTKLKHLTIHHLVGNWANRKELELIPLTTFGSIFILADQSYEDNITRCDSKSLASLMFIRKIIADRLGALTLSPNPARSGSIRKFNSSGSNVGSSRRLFHTCSADALSLNTSSLLEEDFFSVPSKQSPRMSVSMESRASALERQFSQRMFSPSVTSSTSATAMMATGVRSSLTRAQMLKNNGAMITTTSEDAESSSFYVKRHSPVGQNLFFENKTGATILISEILDANTKALIPGTDGGVGDYVMSNEAVACALAMVSECREVNVVIHELLQAQGNDLHLRSALDYGFPGEKIDFWQLQARARARAEICIGYRGYGDHAPNLNPKEKSAKIVLHPKSMIIVLSEDNGGERSQLSAFDLIDAVDTDSELSLTGDDDEGYEDQAMERQLEKDKVALSLQQQQQQLYLSSMRRKRFKRLVMQMLESEFVWFAMFPVLATGLASMLVRNQILLAFVLLVSVAVVAFAMRVSSRSTRTRQATEAAKVVAKVAKRRASSRSRGDFLAKQMQAYDSPPTGGVNF
ncbi:hypothetical protein BASA81_000128 [Batrachochytrium salamandrivorans]|nr:hypothetical protein BASA81_000128 [Batrachochytrium salamandrivorans]